MVQVAAGHRRPPPGLGRFGSSVWWFVLLAGGCAAQPPASSPRSAQASPYPRLPPLQVQSQQALPAPRALDGLIQPTPPEPDILQENLLRFTSDGKELRSISGEKVISRNLATGVDTRILTFEPGVLIGAVSADGRRMVAVRGDQPYQLVDIDTRKTTPLAEGWAKRVRDELNLDEPTLSLSADGLRLVEFAAARPRVMVYDARTFASAARPAFLGADGSRRWIEPHVCASVGAGLVLGRDPAWVDRQWILGMGRSDAGTLGGRGHQRRHPHRFGSRSCVRDRWTGQGYLLLGWR
jgi:hypothetical protein